MTWMRATTPEKVETRRQEIIDAARKLFSKKSYEAISLNSIAAEAGFAKSNVYRYFSTREEIFLTIYISLLNEWSIDLLEFYGSVTPKQSVDLFAKGFAKTTAKHGNMLALSSHLFVSLEKNSSAAQLREFKKNSLSICKQHHIELQRIYPTLTFDDVVFFLKMVYSAMSSFATMSQPNKQLKKLMAEKEFKPFDSNFQREFERAIAVTLKGMLS